MEKYQSNSYRSKELQRIESKTAETQEEKRVQKVVNGKVTTRKNNTRKITDMFISEDASNVRTYVVMDVIVPAFKKLVYDIFTDGIDMILYGGTGGGSRKTSSGSKVSYRKYYDERHNDRDRRESRYSDRNRFDYDDIEFESRGEAEAVRMEMLDCIDRYGTVSVADMYDMAGLSAPYTSSKFGWSSIRTAEVKRVRGGKYIIDLPKAIAFD